MTLLLFLPPLLYPFKHKQGYEIFPFYNSYELSSIITGSFLYLSAI